ncbi:hypothetical protein R16034_04853 [Ralstonia edaphis]|uniref:Uncharacterized protein n=1 Tax=Ralstonia edaphi TaxID=3058599 RepID=A0AB72XAV1_9RALS|nr:hypothetical protein R16034_04853 [Ralstonia sp. LMG 6871]
MKEKPFYLPLVEHEVESAPESLEDDLAALESDPQFARATS